MTGGPDQMANYSVLNSRQRKAAKTRSDTVDVGERHIEKIGDNGVVTSGERSTGTGDA